MKWWGGLVALAGGATAGGLLGAAFAPAGTDRSYAVGMGIASGLTLTGIASLGAIVAPETRAAGLTAAGVVTGLVVLGAASGAHKQLGS
jgi:hypothetical protein